jgi:hypothetical protein
MKLPEAHKNPELRSAIEAYNLEKTTLNRLRETQDVPIDSIQYTLASLAEKLSAINKYQDESWMNSNADAYEHERSELYHMREDTLEESVVPDGFTVPVSESMLKLPSSTPMPLPPINPIIFNKDPSNNEIAARVSLAVLGIGFLISGIGSLVMAGFKIMGVNAAVRAAKTAADLAVRQAAEAAIPKLVTEVVSFAVAGTGAIAGGIYRIDKSVKGQNEEGRTVPETPALTQELEPLRETMTPPPLSEAMLPPPPSLLPPPAPSVSKENSKFLPDAIRNFDKSKLRKSSASTQELRSSGVPVTTSTSQHRLMRPPVSRPSSNYPPSTVSTTFKKK